MSDSTRAYRFAVNVTPKPGILDPQGKAVERSLPHLGIAGVSGVRVGRRVELTVEAADEAAARAVVDRLAGELLSNPLMEQFAVEPLGEAGTPARQRGERALRGGGARMTVRVGVVLFPGSNRDIDAVNALRVAGAEPEILWHEDADLAGVAGILLPGGFAYGDYLRAGVIARFSPVMRAVADFAASAAAPCWGSATGSRSWPRRGWCPGPCCGTAACASSAARSTLLPEHMDTPFTREIGERRPLRMPVAHGEGCYYADEATLDELERDGQVLWRYANADGSVAGPDDAGNPNGSLRGIAGVRNAAGNVAGLMPHPETAVRGDPGLRRRSRDHPLAGGQRGGVGEHGLDQRDAPGGRGRDRRGCGMTAPAPAAPPDPGARGRGARGDPREAGARPERPRAGHVQRHVERALLLQELAARCSRRCRRRARTSSPGWASRRASSPSATASRSRSRSRATTTRPRWSRTRAPRPASAGSCATCSRWAPARSRSWTRCASAIRPTRGRGTSWTASCAASAATATASACRRWAASSSSTRRYQGNPLVNVMAIGLLEDGMLMRASADGPGNLVVLYGSATGRDGIGGASVLASATFGEQDPSASARPSRSATRSRRSC